MTADETSGRLPDLMGCPRVQIPMVIARSSETTLRLGERLWNLDDLHLARLGDRLMDCATNTRGDRCQITTLCPRCGRRAAVRERMATERDYANAAFKRALVTRTVLASSITTGHRVLLDARRAQTRSAPWLSSFWCGRGRIEAVPCEDGRWLVHVHEQCLLRVDALPETSMRVLWTRHVGAEGLAGGLHVTMPDRRAARRGRSFRPALLLLHEEATLRPARLHG